MTVAVTGGIGTGKSTVSKALGERGAVVIDSDRLAREVVAVGSSGLAAVAQRFGPDMVTTDGALDRAALAAVVFRDPQARRELEAITHPLIRARFRELREAAADGAIVVNDIPLLLDLPTAAGFDLVIGVHAPDPARIDRLVRRGLAEDDARRRIAAQIGDDVRRPLSDVWLSNAGTAAQLAEQVTALWWQRLVPMRDNIAARRAAPRSGAVLTDPDPGWPADAARLAGRISRAVGGARVDHIGSTAVPGLPAKDVIDLQLGVESLEQADAWRDRLDSAGFIRLPGGWFDTPHPADGSPDGWPKRLHANADPGRSVNLHVRVIDGPAWRWALRFRDWITAVEPERVAYLAVKRTAATRFGAEPGVANYALEKEPWLAATAERCAAWARATGWQPGPGLTRQD